MKTIILILVLIVGNFFINELAFAKSKGTPFCGMPAFEKDPAVCDKILADNYEHYKKNNPSFARQQCLENCGSTPYCEKKCGGSKYEPMQNCEAQCGSWIGDCYDTCSKQNNQKSKHPDSCAMECKAQGLSEQYCSNECNPG